MAQPASPFAPPAEAPTTGASVAEVSGWLALGAGFAAAWGVFLGALGAWNTAEALALFGAWPMVPRVLAPHLVASHGPSAACLATAVVGMILVRNARPTGRLFPVVGVAALFAPATLASVVAAAWWLQRVPQVDTGLLWTSTSPSTLAIGLGATLGRGALLALIWPWAMGWHQRGASVWWSVPAVLGAAFGINVAVQAVFTWAH